MNLKKQTVLPEGTIIRQCPPGRASGLTKAHCRCATRGRSKVAVTKARWTATLAGYMTPKDGARDE